jgi:hypothetical protein
MRKVTLAYILLAKELFAVALLDMFYSRLLFMATRKWKHSDLLNLGKARLAIENTNIVVGRWFSWWDPLFLY